MRGRHLVVGLLLVASLTTSVLAQEFRATVNGKVTDPQKALIQGATVTVINLETNEKATVITNSEGAYTVPFLKPGIYSITAEAPGFKKHTRDRQELQVDQTATINFELEVGAASESVTVTADAPLLEETKADRGTVIDNDTITELPLVGRNPFMLATLAAGVTFDGNPIYQRPFDNGAIAEFSVNGGRSGNNEFTLDGAPNNALVNGGNNIALVPPVDAVQEFKIVTNAYDAQYGRTSGGIINVSLKSGSNVLHGSIYEFARRDFLDANTIFSNTRGIPVGKFRNPDGTLSRAALFLDQYGVQLNGPVYIPKLYNGRNKTFFLFNVEDYREGTPNPAVRTVPSEAFLRGDFSGLRNAQGQQIVIYDPATGRNVGGRWVRDPFPGNKIPENRIHPFAKKLIPFYPKPNTITPGTDPWRQNFLDIPNFTRDDFQNWVFKIDQVIGTRDKMYFRYGYNKRTEIRRTNGVTEGPAQDGQLPLIRANHSGVFDWVHTFGSNLVLNVRASANRFVEIEKTIPGLGFDATELGFPKSLVDQLPLKIFPRINATDFISLGRQGVDVEPTNAFTFQPNVMWIRGNHTTRFGLDFRITQYSRQQSGNGGLRLDFNRGFTQREFNRGDPLNGNSIASLLLGAIAGGSVDFNATPIYMWKYYSPWIQDDWKVNNRLTLNFGLRWDVNTPIRERFGRQNYFFDKAAINPVSGRIDRTKFPAFADLRGGLLFVGEGGNPDSPWRLDTNNIQPRVGFAFRLDKKTVLRGGGGRYFLNPTTRGHAQGFSVQTPLQASLDGNRKPVSDFSQLFPNGITQPPGNSRGLESLLGRGLSYSNPNFEIPYVYQFSLGIQRQLGWRTVLDVSYVGSRAYKLQSSFAGINEPSLEFRKKCDVTQGGNRNFCDELLPNPFFRVPGFEGTSHFNNMNLSRYNLARPFPHFGGITETERNDGRSWYNSLQMTVNRRIKNGLTLIGTYTFSKIIDEIGFLDAVAQIKNRSVSGGDRPHRVTVSAISYLPIGRGRRFLSDLPGVLDHLIGGWEMAGAWIYESGRPWDLPNDLLYLRNAKVSGSERRRFRGGVELIQGVRPCVERLVTDPNNPNVGTYQLLANSVAYGCKEANFRFIEPFQTRTTQDRATELRRPSFTQFDVNFAKNFRVTEKTRLQFRFEAFNVLNTPVYSTRNYNGDENSAEFGAINKFSTLQSNRARNFQLALKYIF